MEKDLNTQEDYIYEAAIPNLPAPKNIAFDQNSVGGLLQAILYVLQAGSGGSDTAPGVTTIKDGFSGNATKLAIDTAGRLTLPAGAATEATLNSLLNAVKAQLEVATTIFVDSTGAYFVRRDVVNEGTGQITVAWTAPDGTAATPVAPLRPASTTAATIAEQAYDVLTAATGYAVGDILIRAIVRDASSVTSIWFNVTQGTVLGTNPNQNNLREQTQNVNTTITVNGAIVSNANGLPVAVLSLPSLPAGAAIIGQVIQSLGGSPISATNPMPNNIQANMPPTVGTVAAVGQTVTITNLLGYAGAIYTITGTWAGTIVLEYSDDGTTWTQINDVTGSSSFTSNRAAAVNVAPHPMIRLRMTVFTSGTASISITPIWNSGSVMIGGSTGFNAVVQIAGDQAGATYGLETIARNYGYNRARSSYDRLLVSDIGVDPGLNAKGALTLQGSTSGIPVPVVQKPTSTGTPYAAAAMSATSSVVAPATANRQSLVIKNPSTSSTMYLSPFGTTTTAAGGHSHTIPPGGSNFITFNHTGQITGCLDAGAAAVTPSVTEFFL